MAPTAHEACDGRRADPDGRPAGWFRRQSSGPSSPASRRARELADVLEQRARELMQLAAALTDAQWLIRVPGDRRTIGALVHEAASVYPLEVQLAQAVAAGQPATNVLDDIDHVHVTQVGVYGAVTKAAALDLLRRNSAAAAAAIRAMSDEQLDRAAPVSRDANTPLTCQFVLEDHAIRQSSLYLGRIQTAIRAHDEALERLRRQLVTSQISFRVSQFPDDAQGRNR